MTVLTREFRASFAFVERNFNLTKRYWGWEIAWLVYSVAGALSVSLIGRSLGDAMREMRKKSGGADNDEDIDE